MIYRNYELKAYLKNLTLVGQDEWGNIEWTGGDSDFRKFDREVLQYENN